jgi:ubiquinone biosynthesis protein Coq4
MRRLVRDPCALGQVFALADALADRPSRDALVGAFSQTRRGRVGLLQRYRARLPDDALALPVGTVGRELAEMLAERGLDPNALPELPVHTAAAWVGAHIYESHDAWHIVTGFDTSALGETALAAFYVAQMPSRLHVALLAAAMLRLLTIDMASLDQVMDAIARGWRAGRDADSLLGLDWNAWWDRPLSELRDELRLA